MLELSRTAIIKPSHRAIQGYYAALEAFDPLNVSHEMGVRAAFQTLLAETAMPCFPSPATLLFLSTTLWQNATCG